MGIGRLFLDWRWWIGLILDRIECWILFVYCWMCWSCIYRYWFFWGLGCGWWWLLWLELVWLSGLRLFLERSGLVGIFVVGILLELGFFLFVGIGWCVVMGLVVVCLFLSCGRVNGSCGNLVYCNYVVV